MLWRVLTLCNAFALVLASKTGDEVSYCGNWQAAYSRLHARILKGEAPPRYAVSAAVDAGLADNLVGLITELFYAVLTDRAFQITTHHPLPDYAAAFDSPNINWTRHVNDPHSLFVPLRVHHQGDYHYGPEIDSTKYAGVRLINDNKLNEVFATGNLRSWPEGGLAETVFLSSNRGRVVEMFNNPHHSHELYAMGLRPDTIFACGYNYLFKPNIAVKDLFREYMGAIASVPSALKIGINIRAGDGIFTGQQVAGGFEKAYIDCALQIEQSRRRENQTVVWYVISESLELRRKIKEEHGNDRTVVTDVSTVVQHINCASYGQNACNPKLTADDALRMAVGQLWVFSATDVQVISSASGFGRVGAFLSPKFHNIYSIEGFHTPGEPRQCGRFDYDAIEASAEQWSGIR